MDEEFVLDDGAVGLAVTYDNDLFTFETFVADVDMLRAGESKHRALVMTSQVRELVDWLTEMLP